MFRCGVFGLRASLPRIPLSACSEEAHTYLCDYDLRLPYDSLYIYHLIVSSYSIFLSSLSGLWYFVPFVFF